MNKNFIRLVCAVLAVLMVVTLAVPLFVNAGPAADEYNKLQGQLDSINKEIEALKSDKAKEQKRRQSLQSQTQIVEQQIALKQQEIEEKQEEINLKQQELDKKKIDIADSEDLLKERLRAMYVMHNTGVLSTVMGVTSFAEMLTAAESMRRVTQSDTELISKLNEEKIAIEEQQAQLDIQMAELDNAKVELDGKKAELASLLKQSNASLSQIEADQQAQQEEYDKIWPQYVAAKEEMEKEFLGSSGADFVGGEFGWPVPNFHTISSYYGPRTLYGKYDYHTGIDIAGGGQVIHGKPIVASLPGTVKVAKYGIYGYGNYVILDHGGGVLTLYGHCSELAVTAGQFVEKGQIIAYVGSTGNSTGPHLHFEIRQNGTHVNPLPYLKG